MRKIILVISVSLDGFFEGPDHDIEWNMVDEEVHQYFNDMLAPMGGILEGRRSYELMEDFWPTADQDPEAPAQIKEFAGIWRNMPKFVFSRTLQHAGDNAVIVRDVVPEEIEALKALPGGDLVVGGPDLASTFLRLGLIDEFRISVHPILIGRGTPLFQPSDTRVPLELVETHRFGNGVVHLRYDVVTT